MILPNGLSNNLNIPYRFFNIFDQCLLSVQDRNFLQITLQNGNVNTCISLFSVHVVVYKFAFTTQLLLSRNPGQRIVSCIFFFIIY